MIRAIRKMIIPIKDDRGLAAIEYAILGAVIGLGIVAGLVATRSSLNTQLASISSKASAGSSTSSPAAVQPSYFSDKTISVKYSGANNFGGTNLYVGYTDGSFVNYSTRPGIYQENNAVVLETIDRKTGNMVNMFYNTDGVLTYVNIVNNITNVRTYSGDASSLMSGDPPIKDFVRTDTYNPQTGQTLSTIGMTDLYSSTAKASADARAYYGGML